MKFRNKITGFIEETNNELVIEQLKKHAEVLKENKANKENKEKSKNKTEEKQERK